MGGGVLLGRQVPKMGMETLAVITVGPSDLSALLQPAPFPLSRASLLGSLCCSTIFSGSLVPWGRIQTLPLCLQALHPLALPTFLSLLLEPSFTLNRGRLPSESREPCHSSVLYELAEVSPFRRVWGFFWTCMPPHLIPCFTAIWGEDLGMRGLTVSGENAWS